MSRWYGLVRREKIVASILVVIMIIGIIGLLNSQSNKWAVQVPANGGTLREGILGTPRFINPVLATSDIDQDLTQLVYSGLIRRDQTNDNSESIIIPDLAESYSISDDGKKYTFILKKNAVFHDGKKVTADDVAFTVKTIQDTQFQSPIISDWLGITTEVIDPQTIIFTLPRAYSGFIDSTSVGILPKHIWGTLTVDEFLASNRNNIPIGSGPFKITDIDRDASGIPSSYTLRAFKKFTLQKPYINKIIISLYPNQQDLTTDYQSKKFDLLANIHPYEISPGNTSYTATTQLPRMFGLFFNPSRNQLFADPALQKVLGNAINDQEIITTVFQGYATSINHPLSNVPQNTQTPALDPNIVSSQLESLGWKLNTDTGIRTKNGKNLAFTISTADTPELKYSAQIIQKQLKNVGIATELQVFQLSDLENSVIKPRSFDVLLFGQLIRNDADLYAFWHSSQKTDPGLNITGYSNQTLDTALEKLLTATNTTVRSELLRTIQQQISSAPIIWLYQPDFIYALHKPVYGIHLKSLINKQDRFLNIYEWYLQTDTVWKVFQK